MSNNNTLVNRYFTIKDDVFFMYSRIDGEYGPQLLITSGDFEGEIHQTKVANSAPLDFEFRLGELQYFAYIFATFNPKLKANYELPTQEPQTP